MSTENLETKKVKSGSEYNAGLINTLPDAASEIGNMSASVVGSIFFSVIGAGILF